MSKLTIDGFLLCVMASAACTGEGSSPAGGTANAFVGRWACSDALSVTFTSPADIPMQNRTQSSTLGITGDAALLTSSKETDSGTNCRVTFTSSGSTGTLREGQTCMTSEGLTLTYTSGSATVNGSSLNSTFNFDAAGNISMNGMMVPATATGTQTSTCSRLSNPTTGGATTTGGW